MHLPYIWNKDKDFLMNLLFYFIIEKYVFIGVDVTTEYYIRQMEPEEACVISGLPGMYLKGGIAIGMQHKSPFRNLFDIRYR